MLKKICRELVLIREELLAIRKSKELGGNINETYKTITIHPDQKNSETKVLFWVASHDWSTLRESKEWIAFLKLLEGYQIQYNQKHHQVS